MSHSAASLLTRLEIATLASLDAWAASHEVSRSDAFRRLVELGLKAKK